MVRGQVSAISYFSSNFFSRLQLPSRTSTFRTTSILLHDVNSFSQLQLFFTTLTFFHEFNFPALLQLSCTTSTFLHDFNLFHDFNFFYDFHTSTFQHELNIAMSKWIWTPQIWTFRSISASGYGTMDLPPPLRCQCIRTEEFHLCCDRKEHRHHPKPPNR